MKLNEIREEENKREERLFKRFTDTIKRRAFNVVMAEYRGKKLPEKVYKKYMITPEEFLNRSFTKISIASLYRRYRQVELKTLVRCLGIVGRSDTLEQAKREIALELQRIGESHKDSKSRRKE